MNGILTPMGDADALAAALGALLVDPCRASSVARAGWDLVRARFTAARSARGVEAAYEECLDRRMGGTGAPLGKKQAPDTRPTE